MAKKIVVYKSANPDDIVGYYTFSRDATADLYPRDPSTQQKIELPLDHPASGEQSKWKIENEKLKPR